MTEQVYEWRITKWLDPETEEASQWGMIDNRTWCEKYIKNLAGKNIPAVIKEKFMTKTSGEKVIKVCKVAVFREGPDQEEGG